MRKITHAEIMVRSKQALRIIAERVPYIRHWVLPSGSGCFAGNISSAEAFATLPQMLPVPVDFSFEIKESREVARSSAALQEIADKALEGRFDLLGMRDLYFGKPIDWHLEPTSGKRSPLVHWKRLDNLDDALTGDKKVVWELNRHQHLLALAHTYLQTGDERYANCAVDHIISWIRNNPPAIGINWTSSLELAFRCISWLWTLSMLHNWRGWHDLPLLEIEESLYAQGLHIESYLSTYYSPNTHLTGEALGLYYLGLCLPELKNSDRWRSLGCTILLEQLDIQVRSDGVYFEQSTWYQRYTFDFYTHFMLLADRAGENLPQQVSGKVQLLLDFLMWITRPDGTSPFIGDDDGGKLMKLDACAPNDWRATLSTGATMFERGEYKFVASQFHDETYCLLGASGKDAFDRVLAEAPTTKAHAFPKGGYFVMRSGWTAESNYLLIDCGPHGMLNCGHAHADALSIEVAALGTTILVDPGTFTYSRSSELRNSFRSTGMHNSLTVDGLSSSIPARQPFKWDTKADYTTRCWHVHPDFCFFEGSHDGYSRLTNPATHTRSILFVNNEYWIILDRVRTTGQHLLTTHFHFAAGVECTNNKAASLIAATKDSTSLDICYPEAQGTWLLEDGLISPCYGQKVIAPVATYTALADGPAEFLAVLYPRKQGDPSPAITMLHPTLGKGMSVECSNYQDVLLWFADALPDKGIYETDFEWTWIRRSCDGTLKKAHFLHGSRFRIPEVAIKLEHPIEFVAISISTDTLSIDVTPPSDISIEVLRPYAAVFVNGRRCDEPVTGFVKLEAEKLATRTSDTNSNSICTRSRLW